MGRPFLKVVVVDLARLGLFRVIHRRRVVSSSVRRNTNFISNIIIIRPEEEEPTFRLMSNSSAS